jgi:hypothetical protein
MTVEYQERIEDGRHVLIIAQYEPADFTPGAESEEKAYITRILDFARLDKLAPGENRDRADIRLELAHIAPRTYKRLRAEVLERVCWELDCISGETGNIRREARA